jgi:AcrR family transcriptional regulator
MRTVPWIDIANKLTPFVGTLKLRSNSTTDRSVHAHPHKLVTLDLSRAASDGTYCLAVASGANLDWRMMGRPSLAESRRAQILDAYEECVLQFGMEASSLEAIADQAGIKRSVVRHYMGNRAELRRAFVERIISRATGAYQEALADQRRVGGIEGVIDYIAGPEFPDKREDALIDALFAASHSDPSVRAQLRKRYVAFQRAVASELRAAFPDAEGAEVSGVAYALVCLAYGSASMQDLGIPYRRLGDVRTAAQALVTGTLGRARGGQPKS